MSWIQLSQDMEQWWTFMNTMEETGKIKGKAIPVTGHGGP
jgi:hypothetical protein